MNEEAIMKWIYKVLYSFCPFFFFLNAAEGLWLAKLTVYPPQVYQPPFISS